MKTVTDDLQNEIEKIAESKGLSVCFNQTCLFSGGCVSSAIIYDKSITPEKVIKMWEWGKLCYVGSTERGQPCYAGSTKRCSICGVYSDIKKWLIDYSKLD